VGTLLWDGERATGIPAYLLALAGVLLVLVLLVLLVRRL
jgi:LPXTG-motif cell wall-anchored protein